jgi:phosphoribosylformylglycinamidine synthase
MKIDDIKVCILRIEGTNCESEMYWSFKRLGAKPEIIHLNQLLGKIMPRSLEDYQILMLPGGFSAGDYIRAGAILAARLKALRTDLIDFIEEGKPLGGVCNGFQVLVEIGLLPAFKKIMTDQPEAALTVNSSARFECRPTFLKLESNKKCVFAKKLDVGRVVMLPSAHAEGNFTFLNDTEKKLAKLIENEQLIFRYVSPDGKYAGYPWNPNGSFYNIAGICNKDGNVFGLMPHPERVFYRYQHPDWCTKGLKPESAGDGRIIFESVLEYVCKKF